MASGHDEDPFLQVQADVLTLLTTTRSLFSSYIRIRSSATSANSPELIDARNELEQALQDLSTDLRDLVGSVKAVEHDPYRYGLELDELGRRRKLVEDVGNELENMRDELKAKVNDAQSKGKGAANGDMLPDPDSFDEQDDYAAFEQERQLELMNEQDKALDDVFVTVGNLQRQANDMGRELEEQNEMLNEVDTLADRVGGKIQTGIKKVGHIMRKNEDKYSSCCIAVLIFVLIVILVLLVILW